jgi:chromate reductase
MIESKPVRVLAMVGSLRAKSYNKMALKAAIELAPPDMTIETFDLLPIPLFNQDVLDAGMPAPVADLRARIKAADALLLVTPEYNYSVSGVLKNAIDWASRPPAPPLVGKPTAIMGATVGVLGTSRAQYHLRQIAVFVDMHLVNKPEVMIAQAANKFDANGRLTDETARGLVRDLMAALHKWTNRLREG